MEREREGEPTVIPKATFSFAIKRGCWGGYYIFI